MNELKSTKYMNTLTSIGLFVGFGIIIVNLFLNINDLYTVAGVIIIFIFRTIGYGIDRLIERRDEKK
ncbi:MAG: hypothetical protein LUG12_03835 [Erysipelotrichaceae bacterium]|nr:hypothetical protein [Erysipelotrichaceae bacterium]